MASNDETSAGMPDLSTPLAWALRYAEIGWHVLPLEPRGKQPLGRLVPRGMLDATTDPEIIRAWWGKAPAANIGISLAQSGLVAVDVDPRNGGTETFEQLQLERGSLRSEVMAFTGGGGEHHVFVVPPGAQLSLPGTLGPGIDLKCNGYIVVEPSIHPSGKAYGWEASSNPLDHVVPSTLPDWLRSLRVHLETPKPGAGDIPVDPKTARDVREALYVLDAEDYHQWIQAGMALHHTGWGQAAYAIWCAWAQQSDKFDATVSRKKWGTFNQSGDKGGLTVAWIFGEAQRRGWVNPATRIRDSLREVRRESGPPPEWIDEPPPEGDLREPAKEQLLPLLTLAQLQEKAGQLKWLVKGAVPLESIGVLFGASGAFKSFIAIDLALHIAHGRAWMGRKTKQAPVIIIAAEGGAGLWRRVEAWHREHGIEWQDAPVYVIPMSVDLTTDCSRVIEAASALGVVPGLMVIDTLSQTFSGEENSATEVAAYLRELGLWFREAWLCAVLVIHHSGHNAAERPRGSSALRANVDFMMGCHRDEKEMIATLSCHKQKDGEPFEDATFGLSVFELGRDDDGDAITALVAAAVSSEEAKAELVQYEAARGRSGRNALIIDLAEDGMDDQALRKAFYEDCGVPDAEARRQAYYRALNWATKHRLLEIVEHRVILSKVVRADKDHTGA